MLDLAQVSWKQAGWLGDPQFPTAARAAGERIFARYILILIDFSTLSRLACGCAVHAVVEAPLRAQNT